MQKLTQNKRKLLEQINQSNNQTLPPNVKKIYQRAFSESFSLQEKFKNLQNPLAFIHNGHIQGLVDKTEQTSQILRKQMQETSQFSKTMYKKIISRDGNEFNFDNLKENSLFLNNRQNDYTQIMKAQKSLKKKFPSQAIKIIQKKRKINEQNSQKIKKMRAQRNYRHQSEIFLSKGKQQQRVQLTYEHIKLVDSPEFQKNHQNVELFELIKPSKTQYHRVYNQSFDIYLNPPVQKLMGLMQFPLIENSCQFHSTSQQIFYDFERNLTFWGQHNKNQTLIPVPDMKPVVQKKSQESIMSQFYRFNKKQIQINNVCDFAMRKITCQTLGMYFGLKKQHKTKMKMDKNNQNIDQMYNQLKKQYEYAHQNRLKSKNQRLPLKFLETECQTIRILQQNDFDSYFTEQTRQIFDKLVKLSIIRQKAMLTKEFPNRLTLMKNVCIDINQNLFKVLLMILKGQKFYPRYSQNQTYFSPFFTYSDLFQVQNRDEVEVKILELIYAKINQFQCDIVDGIEKTKLIKIYVQEKQKNNKIMEIIDAE